MPLGIHGWPPYQSFASAWSIAQVPETETLMIISPKMPRHSKHQQAFTVAKGLVEKFFVYYGLPQHIHSDQGSDFS